MILCLIRNFVFINFRFGFVRSRGCVHIIRFNFSLELAWCNMQALKLYPFKTDLSTIAVIIFVNCTCPDLNVKLIKVSQCERAYMYIYHVLFAHVLFNVGIQKNCSFLQQLVSNCVIERTDFVYLQLQWRPTSPIWT